MRFSPHRKIRPVLSGVIATTWVTWLTGRIGTGLAFGVPLGLSLALIPTARGLLSPSGLMKPLPVPESDEVPDADELASGVCRACKGEGWTWLYPGWIRRPGPCARCHGTGVPRTDAP